MFCGFGNIYFLISDISWDIHLPSKKLTLGSGVLLGQITDILLGQISDVLWGRQ